MAKTYIMGGTNNNQRFVCINTCSHQYNPHCDKYLFFQGETYEYDYLPRKVPISIYFKGKYNGSVTTDFIDKNFMTEEDYNKELDVIDGWFESLLESNVKIKKIKNDKN